MSTPADVLAAARALCDSLDAIWNQERAFLSELSAALSVSTVQVEQAMREQQSREWGVLDRWALDAVTRPTQRRAA